MKEGWEGEDLRCHGWQRLLVVMFKAYIITTNRTQLPKRERGGGGMSTMPETGRW